MGKKVDYSGKTIIDNYGNEVKILELHEQRRRASYWKYICPYCGCEDVNDIDKIKKAKTCKNCRSKYLSNVKQKTNKVIKNKKIRTPRKTTDVFKQEVYNLCKEEFVVLGEYINSNTKIKILHNKCNKTFDMKPSNFLSGQRCPHCRYNTIAEACRIKDEDFLKEVYDLVQDEYSVKSAYVNRNTKVLFHHNMCNNDFWMTPSTFIHKGARCTNKECLHNRVSLVMRDTPEEFQVKFNKKSNEEYELLSEYTLSNEKVLIKHNECGESFWMSPNDFLQGQGCTNKECIRKRIREKRALTKEEFIQRINSYNDNLLLLSDYVDMDTKVTMQCKKCNHIWDASPSNLLYSQTSCPKCKISHGEKVISNYLDSNNIIYECQKKFDNLLGLGNGKLSYDFYLPNEKILIEFQGKQHYKPVSAYGGEEQFNIQQEHDRRKRQYAKDNNIKLLEIAYWDFENIEQILSRELGLVA